MAFSKLTKDSSRAMASLSMLWLLLCLALGGSLIAWGLNGTFDSRPAPAVSATPVVSMAPSQIGRRPIEQVAVGSRVVTPETEPSSDLASAVDPSTWKLLELRLEDVLPDGTPDPVQVRTLQPPEWIEQHHAQVGAKVPMPLDLKEMGLPDGLAEVVSVGPCPAIPSGPGRVVLTTVNHLNCYLFDLKVGGERAPPQEVHVTGWHKLFSQDRGEWVSVCQLKEGETLAGREGGLKVLSLVRHPGTQRVYNMTVEGEHVYYVSAVGLLAHNNNCSAQAVENAVADGLDLALRYKPGWTAAQRAEAAAKVQILNDAETVVTKVQRSGTSAAARYRQADNVVSAGNDVDHMVDLQLGGLDNVSNMWPLNSSVNRSLGSQIQWQIKDLPIGTRINNVIIGD